MSAGSEVAKIALIVWTASPIPLAAVEAECESAAECLRLGVRAEAAKHDATALRFYRKACAWGLADGCAYLGALMLVPETVTARPRFLFTAFPLFIAVAAWWPDPQDDPDHHRASWDRGGWDFLLVLCGAGLATLTGLYGVFGAIP